MPAHHAHHTFTARQPRHCSVLPIGFTITELLVAIAVLTLLLGMLLPALSGVRLAGRATLCQSNLRHMVNASMMYANIHQEYPSALTIQMIGGAPAIVSWDWITRFDGELVGPGPLWEYTENPGEVMQCPEFFGNSNSHGDPYTGYNYSPYIGGEQAMTPPYRFYRGVRPHTVSRPSSCAMFGLGGYRSGANKFMRAPKHNDMSDLSLPPMVLYSGGQAYDRYRGVSFVAYVDGHVGSHNHPEQGEDATSELLEQMDFPRNGFLSENNDTYRPH